MGQIFDYNFDGVFEEIQKFNRLQMEYKGKTFAEIICSPYIENPTTIYAIKKFNAMDFYYHPINPFQDNGFSKGDRATINAMRETAYVCGYRGGDVEHVVHQALKKMGRYDLLPPCERDKLESEE